MPRGVEKENKVEWGEERRGEAEDVEMLPLSFSGGKGLLAKKGKSGAKWSRLLA